MGRTSHQGRSRRTVRVPDARGHFGPFGGRYVPETLMAPLLELECAFRGARRDPQFRRELTHALRTRAGRPTPLTFAARLTEESGGARIYLKREDLCHTGSHKINNCLGQALLARRMQKRRLIAETGAGQHGVATATVAALLGFECEIYMGEEDMARQALNVHRMRFLGAKVTPVASGSRTLKDAMSETLRDWAANVRTTHYLIGSTAGPHPYPMMVREFQSVIGRETRVQVRQLRGGLPDCLVACVGGGSNALGLFFSFLRDPVRMVGVEAAGGGIETGRHAAALTRGRPGVLHGSYSYLLQQEDGQIHPAHSVAAGLDYPGVGPEHSYLKETGRVEYVAVTDAEALEAFEVLTRIEGVMPALESSHALAQVRKLAPTYSPEQVIVVCLSGRGDKDVQVVADYLDGGRG